MPADRRDPAADAQALTAAVDAADVDAVVALTREWPETHRTAVRKHVRERLDRLAWQLGWTDRQRARRQAFTGALLAIGTPTMIERDRRFDPLGDDTVVALLRGRAPSVLQTLPGALNAMTGWDLLGPLWRAGLVDATEPVVAAMLRGLSAESGAAWRHDDSFLRGLEAHPEVLDRGLLWQLFDHEAALAAAEQRVTWAQDPDRAQQRDHSRRHNQVIHALAALVDDGEVDRQRLLDATLGALERDMAQAPNRFLVHLHDRLAPRTDELSDRSDVYLHLLHHPRPLTVRVALDALGRLLDADALDARTLAILAEDLSGPLTLTQRNLAVAALRLLDRLAKRPHGDAVAALRTVVAALGHPKPEVQERAVALLIRHWPDDPVAAADLRVELLGWLDVVPTSLRAGIDDLTGVETADAPLASGTAVRATETADRVDDLLTEVAVRAAALPASRRDVLTRAAEALRAGTWKPPLPVPQPDAHLLTPDRHVEPVADLDELVQLLLRLLETSWADAAAVDVLSMERAMDGLARLFRQRPDGFDGLTASLQRRIDDASLLGWWRTRMADAPVGIHLAMTVRAWLRPPGLLRRRWRWLPQRQASQVLQYRLERLAARIATGRVGPLLALPTHAPAWVAADTLAERLAVAPPDPVDLDAALLRCAGDVGVVADALGRRGLGATVVAGHLDADVLTLEPRLRITEHRTRWDHFRGFAVDGVEPLWRHPSPLVRRVVPLLSGEVAFDAVAAATIPRWPAVADAAAAQHLFLGSQPGHAWRNEHGEALLALCLDPDRALSGAAHAALVCALTAAQTQVRTLGTDVLLQTAADARLDPVLLGRTLGWLTAAGPLKLNRLEQPLAEALAAGPLARQAVGQAMEAAVGSLQATPNHVHVLLEAWVDVLAGDGTVGPGPAARRWLEQAAEGTGTSRRRRAAQRLLAADGTTGSPPPAASEAAAEAAAMALLDRARRWESAALGTRPTGGA